MKPTKLFIASLVATLTLLAAGVPPAEREAAVAGVARLMQDRYVDPEVGKRMAEYIQKRHKQGAYAALDDAQDFSLVLTDDLRSISKDRHVRVHYSAEVLPPERNAHPAPSKEQLEGMRQEFRRNNYGFPKIEILPGNIGYMDIRYFADPMFSERPMRAAFEYIADTNALIIDFRQNGGSMSLVASSLFASYLVEQPTHMETIHDRLAGTSTQNWSFGYAPGPRYLKKPVYVLTSGRSFSGAEALAYMLKNIKRATLVGQTTGGGANGGGDMRASDHFSVFVPFMKITNTVTKTNWEGTGVTPDVETKPALTLHTAHVLALRETLKDESLPAKVRDAVRPLVEHMEQNAPRTKQHTFRLSGYGAGKEVSVAGTFNDWARRANPMRREGDVWVAEVEVTQGGHAYKFVVDGKYVLDPTNPKTTPGEHGPDSFLEIP